ncbi:hypothetical protein THTE_3873 [Thermogutta terrifontis]|uniref:Uncharacterized protein n=1 Tax=Thermogutta terrifontis TaxID=1331910 RepID=A0A286RKK4_9BACT|nr:hypothetical protein THTE_3873 [Thermogutta terrifontis]
MAAPPSGRCLTAELTLEAAIRAYSVPVGCAPVIPVPAVPRDIPVT